MQAYDHVCNHLQTSPSHWLDPDDAMSALDDPANEGCIVFGPEARAKSQQTEHDRSQARSRSRACAARSRGRDDSPGPSRETRSSRRDASLAARPRSPEEPIGGRRRDRRHREKRHQLTLEAHDMYTEMVKDLRGMADQIERDFLVD
jgi:hypothetical protein